MHLSTKIFSLAFILLYCPLALLAAGAENIKLPDMGDSSGTLISPVQEKKLGEAFFRSLHSKIKINKDPEIQQYIESIGKRLVTHSDSPSGSFHFFVVLDDRINAFAGPGGYIGVNSGLLLLTESESELASVMAHEIAHVTQRHLNRAFEAASKLSIPTAVASLAAILLGTQSPALGQTALVAIYAGNAQFRINFTRDNEQEADRVGMRNLSAANFNPQGMPTFFERLQQSTRYYGQKIPEFLRTHPVSHSRIADTRGRASEYTYKHYPDSQGYLLSRAKLKVITAKKPEQVLDYFKTREHQGTKNQQAVTRYGIATAQVALQKYTEAEQIFQQLTAEYPNQPQYVYALATMSINTNNYTTALQLLNEAVLRFPSNDAIKVKYISTLIETRQLDRAKTTLKSLTDIANKRPLFYELMAKIYAKSGQQAQSHRYLAEYYYATDRLSPAILQINLAKKANGINFYLHAILDQRLQLFTQEKKERTGR